jgi:predicted dehydrogenase
LAGRYRLPHWGATLDEPWVAEAVCASIGTPPGQHAEVTVNLIQRGFHVLCEKPMATRVVDAEAMVACAERYQRVLHVVHNFQFATAMVRARSLLDRGELGDLTAVYALQLSNPSRRLPHWYPSLPGGLFYDEAPHLLYLLRNVLGELRLATVSHHLDHSTSPPQIAYLNAQFDHPTVWAQLTMNFKSPVSEWQFALVGTRQMIVVDIFRDISVLLPNDGRHSPANILRTTWRGVGGHLAGVLKSGMGVLSRRLLYGNETVVSRFLDAVGTTEPSPVKIGPGTGRAGAGTSGQDGLAVVKDIHDIMRYAETPQYALV